MILNTILEKYSHFVSHHIFIVAFIVLIVTIGAMAASSNVGTKNMENRDLIPENIEVIKAFDLLEDSFGTDATIMIAIEVDPQYAGSNEIRDVRDLRVVKYIKLLGEIAKTNNKVESVSSIATFLELVNNGKVPQSKRDIIDLAADNPLADQVVSSDYEMALIRINLVDVETSFDDKEIVDDIIQILKETPKPPGLLVNVAGERAVGPVVTRLITPDIQRTMTASFLGIIMVSFFVFASIRYGLTPLAVIFLGIIWAMGFLGLLNVDLSAQTSGTISMIMGIGIDFGIQITSRFKEEIKKRGAERAMEITMNKVFTPMATTTLAALIGFRAMSMGQLTFFGEFGDIMSIGITACFLAAITVVPVILVTGDRIFKRTRKVFRNPFGKKTSLLTKGVKS